MHVINMEWVDYIIDVVRGGGGCGNTIHTIHNTIQQSSIKSPLYVGRCDNTIRLLTSLQSEVRKTKHSRLYFLHENDE